MRRGCSRRPCSATYDDPPRTSFVSEGQFSSYFPINTLCDYVRSGITLGWPKVSLFIIIPYPRFVADSRIASMGFSASRALDRGLTAADALFVNTGHDVLHPLNNITLWLIFFFASGCQTPVYNDWLSLPTVARGNHLLDLISD